jgi:iron complex outermembrane receptor protein
MQALVDTVGIVHTGNTTYDQTQVVGILSGDLFSLPAGMVGTAFGVEYRHFSIDDQPSQASQDADLWGSSSALVTKGTNKVWEAFAEAEIPIVAGKKGFEDLRLNLSARAFDYDVGGSDWVWKIGLKWVINPTIMLRATAGTSYRAPALFELFLGDQTGFLSQTSIDPCIDWGESSNSNIRTNCEAEGIPSNYTGAGSSATVTSGGGALHLEPETSDAYTYGFVWTPQFADLSIAVDYFDIEVNDQIAQLGASSIISGCYGGDNFPNAFCDLFTRAGANAPAFPFNILDVDDTYINVNEQRVKGIDLNLRWDQDFNFGQLVVEAQSTWYEQNVQRLFDPSLVSGFDTTDYAGSIGSPEFLTNFRASLTRGDWSFNYYLQYVSETDDSLFVDEIDSYYGWEDAVWDITMDAAFYHSISVFYQAAKWDFLIGINNLLDEDPDVISDAGYRFLPWGNVPVAATQYDLLGRRVFMRLNFRF